VSGPGGRAHGEGERTIVGSLARPRGRDENLS
jgi:hypothetical protein